MELEPLPTDRARPTRADQRAFQQLQATSLDRALTDARVWRNGYALLGSGSGAVIAFVGARLGDPIPWEWRVALTFLLGGGLACTAVALWMTLTIEGGKKATTLNLAQIVERHNSFEMYRADQAKAAYDRLDRSKTWALIGAALCFLGLLATLWVPPTPTGPTPGPPPAAGAPVLPSSSPTAAAPTTPTPSASATATPNPSLP